MLTDLEFRVWIQCLLSSDDFGVMLDTPAKLQADNRHLLNRPTKTLRRCLDALVASGLLRRFEHQGQAFIYSHNWQAWQKVEYPRATDMPKIPPSALEACDEGTRALQEKHPGGMRRDKRGTHDPNDSERASQTITEQSPPTRAGAPAVTANGLRQTAQAHGTRRAPTLVTPPLQHRHVAHFSPLGDVPNGLHSEFVRKVANGGVSEVEADQQVRNFYAKTEGEFVGQIVAEDAWKFWRGQFAAKGKTAQPVKAMSDAAALVFETLGIKP